MSARVKIVSDRAKKVRWRVLHAAAFLTALILAAGSGAGCPASAGEAAASVQTRAEGLDTFPFPAEETAEDPAVSPETGYAIAGGTGLFGEPGSDFGKGPAYSFPPAAGTAGNLSLLPDAFSWADLGKKPAVRSQGDLGTCWAITAASAVEAALLPGRRMVFSPDHISLQNGFNISQNEGGDYSMIMSYMASRRGPVLESQDPYGDGTSPSGLRPSACVREMRLLRGLTREEIKSMIYRFGPVQSSLCMDRARTDLPQYSCYDKDTFGYYDPFPEDLNHDILVLGWDDNFSREDFALDPQHGGAWICQNTWGEDFGDRGIFYVAYDDANLFRKGGIAYTDAAAADDCDNVLEQDSLGWQARQGYGAESAYFAGVFESDRDQILEAAGLYATGPSTACRLTLVRGFQDTGDLTRAVTGGGEEDLTQAVSGAGDGDLTRPAGGNGSGPSDTGTEGLCLAWLENPGYYTLNMDREIRLAAGEKFAVIVWIDTPGAEKPVAVETCKDKYTSGVTLKGRETYISPDGRAWDRTQTVYRTNACLKLYMRNE